MLTSRGWWLLLFAVTVTVFGGLLTLEQTSSVMLLGLTILIWIAWEWFVFSLQARFAARRLRLRRELRDDRRSVTTLWAGQSFQVSLHVRLDSPKRIGYARLSDRVPVGVSLNEGSSVFEGAIDFKHEASWSYRIHCDKPGTVRFEGTRVQIADRQGLFYFETFLRDPRSFPVLPKLVDAEAKQRATKRFNRLPPPGVHRHRRPGTGSELLDLRDYQPGDPPKRIAWKISARRDKLITREFESEVPVRCTLLVDSSSSVRLGPPGGNALATLTEIAATVAQAAIGNRDLVGLAVCDEHVGEYQAPARTQRHLITVLHNLAHAAALAPTAESDQLLPLLDRAYALVVDVYPDLVRSEWNRFPSWLPWLSPPPIYRRKHGRLLVQFNPLSRFFRIWRPGVRRCLAWRKKLAVLLSVKYALPAGATALMLEDDAACARWLQRFLIEHRVPFDVPLYDAGGRYLLSKPEKVETLAKVLTRAVSHGHDNELFVVLADLLDLDEHLKPLLRSVQVARARHHQVLVVNAWPEDVPDPNGPDVELTGGETVAELLNIAALGRARRAWRNIRRAFGRLGVPVLNAATGDPARLILHRMEQLRALQGA